MPHPKGWDIPPPEHHQDFEVLCLDVLKAMKRPLVEPNLYGRSGQAQHGVDFTLQLADGLHGYQCKRVEGFTMAEFEAEVAKTARFPNPLISYTVLTTTENDARLQDAVHAISGKRVATGLFPVGIVFWPTIRDRLVAYKDVFREHYPEMAPGQAVSEPLVVPTPSLDEVLHNALLGMCVKARPWRADLTWFCRTRLVPYILGHKDEERGLLFPADPGADAPAWLKEAFGPRVRPVFAERSRGSGDDERTRWIPVGPPSERDHEPFVPAYVPLDLREIWRIMSTAASMQVAARETSKVRALAMEGALDPAYLAAMVNDAELRKRHPLAAQATILRVLAREIAGGLGRWVAAAGRLRDLNASILLAFHDMTTEVPTALLSSCGRTVVADMLRAGANRDVDDSLDLFDDWRVHEDFLALAVEEVRARGITFDFDIAKVQERHRDVRRFEAKYAAEGDDP
jgi:hypothetical protein